MISNNLSGVWAVSFTLSRSVKRVRAVKIRQPVLRSSFDLLQKQVELEIFLVDNMQQNVSNAMFEFVIMEVSHEYLTDCVLDVRWWVVDTR